MDFGDASFLVVKEDANISLTDNAALWKGGAISVNMFAPWPLSNFSSCFLHFILKSFIHAWSILAIILQTTTQLQVIHTP